MKLLGIIARHDTLKFTLAGLLGGAVAYGLMLLSSAVPWFALPVAVTMGVLSSLADDDVVESAFKAILGGAGGGFFFWILPKVMEGHPPLWLAILAGSALGFLVGIVIGSILGAACRLATGDLFDEDPDTSTGAPEDG
ncbi:hypothetical protein OKA04_24160 [Luteolibacter flavescens]|uniref:DUF5518 domain-containing protein n=1 Tax=Luteolibacter flavescens TaxID=1859460 RepID=A0ABT3FWA0_9BACT|nr:hypothetical protein [Luteolibacter flavescens]MCW1887855.1 hypothetical protein [Luteolibacter flavescens]